MVFLTEGIFLYALFAVDSLVQKAPCGFPQGVNSSVYIVYRGFPNCDLVFNFQLLDEPESSRCFLTEKNLMSNRACP